MLSSAAVSASASSNSSSISSIQLTTLTKEQLKALIAQAAQQLAKLEEEEERAKNARLAGLLVPESPPSLRKKSSDPLNLIRPITTANTIVSSSNTSNTAPQSVIQTTIPQSYSSNVVVSSNNCDNNLVITKSKSNLQEGLAAIRKEAKTQTLVQSTKRSTEFATVGEPNSAPRDPRASDLTVKTEIPLGPIKFQPTSSDPDFVYFEPNSQTRLIRRHLPHNSLQEHLSDRYIVRINELYAIIRKLDTTNYAGGTEWNVPLVGDWVLIGVIGQKGEFKTTNPFNMAQLHGSRSSAGRAGASPERTQQAAKETKKNEQVTDDLNESLQQADQEEEGELDDAEFNRTRFSRLQKPKQYVSFKLVDLSSKTISSSGSGVINMILFESEHVTPANAGTGAEDSTNNKTYRGGSGGAYERFWKEQPGTVVAILNPKVLKSRPSQYRPSSGPEVLTITPEKAESLLVIGQAKDLGTCTALRRDTGKECGSWCDLRAVRGVGDSKGKALAVCDFHLQRQVRKVRAGRAEFFSGTSGMTTHTGKKFGQSSKKAIGDAHLKTGLLPVQPTRTSINGQVTYICSGSGPSESPKARQAKNRWQQATDTEKLDGLKRRRKQELEEAQINKMLMEEGAGPGAKRAQSYGAKCVEDARRMKKQPSRTTADENIDLQNKYKEGQLDGRRVHGLQVPEANGDEDASSGTRKSVFSTAAVRAMGFDPTAAKLGVQKPTREEAEANGLDGYAGLLGNVRKTRAMDEELEDACRAKKVKLSGSEKGVALGNAQALARARKENDLSDGHNGDTDDDDDLVIQPQIATSS